jgi:Icc-related predicted phosphoesterase
MKIQLFSDLHIEFEELDVDCSQADVVIFAGDIDVGTKGVAWIQRQNIDCPVIYVPGNHEFYRQSHPRLIQKLRDAASDTNVHVLENTALSIGGVTFHGATLWTDFELFGDPKLAGYKCQEIMNDFKVIRRDPSYSRLRAIDAALIHKNTLYWLGRSLEQTNSAQNVVITHHAPSKKSLPEKSKDLLISAAYASDLEYFINTHKPNCWLHGHIHNSLDYQIGDCRVVCNPRGYTKGMRNPNFDPSLIIEL